MVNFKATIAYDGTDFSGVAEQLNGANEKEIRTVVGELRPIIEMVAQGQPKIVVSGRTDKGVHAREQVLSFSFPQGFKDFDPARMAYVANKKLGPEIVIHSIENCDQDFHARFSAKSRTYRYLIDANNTPDIFSSRFAWHISSDLDIEAMEMAAKVFIGEHDFTSVCKRDESMDHNIREVLEAHFVQSVLITGSEKPLICFEISANSFCWNMVRSIVGVLVDVGMGKITEFDVKQLLQAKQRDSSRTFAPGHGLTLWKVQY